MAAETDELTGRARFLDEQHVVRYRVRVYILVRLIVDIVGVMIALEMPQRTALIPLWAILALDIAGLLLYGLAFGRRPQLSTYLQLVWAGLLVIALNYSLGQVAIMTWLFLVPLGLAGGLIVARPGFNSLVSLSLLVIFGSFAAAVYLQRLPLELGLPIEQVLSLALAVGVILIVLNALVETLVVHLFQTQEILVQTQVQLIQTQSELAQRDSLLYDVQRETRRIEQLSAIGQIARQVSKALRAPLIAIQRQLNRPDADLNQPEVRAAIQAELVKAEELLGGLEQFAGLGDIQPQNVNLDDLLINEQAALHLPPGVTIHLHIPPILQPIQADPDHIRLLLRHLLRNAVEAVGERGDIWVALEPAPEGVRIVIRDNGPGIPADQIPRVFEPLFTTKARGFGLGLAICLQVVRMQGGRIQVESKEGEGTTFTVYLPRVPRHLPEELAQDMAG
ncbi:MAG: ATP-binding protein [Caldilineales bacterium]|nr:ATP-binding protein [Caldilineales bacterium]